MRNKLESVNLSEVTDKVYSTNPEATVWNIFIEILSRGKDKEKYRIWILSELPVIEAIARGYSGRLIRGIYNLDRRAFDKLCSCWKLRPLDEVLDFDPLEIYVEGMTAYSLKVAISPIVIETPSVEELEDCIHNVKIYKEITEYLNELEEKEDDI